MTVKETEGVLIRRMGEEDLEQAARIERELFSQPWSRRSFASSLADGNTRYLAAVQEKSEAAGGDETAGKDRLLGYCGYLRSFEVAEITNMAVDRRMWGHGIGRRLLSALMEQGRREGVERYTLEVRRSNAAAIHLYEKLGFRTEGVRRGFYALPAEDALIMWT